MNYGNAADVGMKCMNPADDDVKSVNFDRRAPKDYTVRQSPATVRLGSQWEASMAEVLVSLAQVLRLAGWGPRQLVTAINGRLSSQGRERLRLDPTAAYPWVKRGYCPRSPIPETAAAVLSEQLGYRVTVAQLWPGRDESGEAGHTAAGDLEGIACVDDLLRELSDLTTTATASSGRYVGASGVDLTAAVLDQLHGAVLLARHQSDREYVPPEQAQLIASHVAALRRLDGRHGGGALSLDCQKLFADLWSAAGRSAAAHAIARLG